MRKQVVPNSPEIESAVLGALMSEPNMIDEVAGLNAELFFTPANALIFGTIRDIRAAGGVPNVIAVTQVIAAAGRAEFVGGAGSLTDMLGKSAGGPAAVEYHVQTLRDLHARRTILTAAGRLSSAASDMTQPADGVLQDAGESVLSLSLGQSTDSMRPASAIVPGLLEELEKLMTPGQKLGVETGFKSLDYLTGGLRPGQLTIVAGRPAMGKSALMLNMCENMVRRGVPALYFSLEMPANELGCRVVLGRAETNIEVIRNGFLDHASKRRISAAADQFASEPMYVDDRGGLTMLDIRGRARLAVRRWGVKAIFVDYLQLVSHAGAQSRENEVGFVSRGLKAMAMELGVPVVAAAQVNRKAEDRSDNRPKMSDLRESGSIEQDADLVLLLHRPCYYAADQETEPDPQDAELHLAKHRAGATGKVNLTWRPRLTRFENAALGNRTSDGGDAVYAPSPKLWEAINE
jgi:replicative DNA helicase